MPALPTVVSDYLTAIKDSLQQGSDLGQDVRGAALNYLRAQDMATVLDLLQDGLDQTTALTATGGTATSVVDGAATFVAGQQVGNVVIFAGNVTATLAGVEARVVRNTATTLFFADGALPATPQSGDEYTIRGGIFDTHIEDLREGKSLADSPAGSLYGESRTVQDALMLGLRQLAGVPDASVVIGTLSPNGLVTVTAAGELVGQLGNAIQVEVTVPAGTSALAASLSGNVLTVALSVSGGTPVALDNTATLVAAEIDSLPEFSATAGGTGADSLSVAQSVVMQGGGVERQSMAGALDPVGTSTTQVALRLLGAKLPIDALRGMKLTVQGEEPTYVVSSDEDGVLTLSRALSAVPTAGTPHVLTYPEDDVGSTVPKLRTHSGAQPGENRKLADLVDLLQTAVVAYTLPT